MEHGYAGAVYYQDGAIMIQAWSHSLKPTDAACRGIIDRIKRQGGVDPATGDPDEPSSSYATLFSYPRIEELAIDESYMETVDSMLQIQATVGVSGDGKAVTCSGKLLSKEIDYQRS